MSERSLVVSALRWLRRQPDVWAFKVAGGVFQRRGVADIIGHVGGRFLWAEAKVGGNKLTQSQVAVREEVRRSGGAPFTFHSMEELKKNVEELRRSTCR